MADDHDAFGPNGSRTPLREAEPSRQLHEAPQSPGPAAPPSPVPAVPGDQQLIRHELSSLHYRRLNEPWRKESVLPQLWRVLDSAPNSSAPGPSSGASAPGHQSSSTGTGIKRRRAEPGITGKLWDVRKGQSAQLEELLDIVGFVLDSEARLYSSDPPTDFNPSHRAFMFPLVSSRGPLTCPCQARCMPYSVDRIREAQAKPHIGKLIGVSSDYIHLVLAYDGDKHGKIIEYAHRLVLWSIFGPPPQDRWVCMHFCNNK